MSESNGHANGRPQPQPPRRPDGPKRKSKPRPSDRPRHGKPSPISLRRIEPGVFELVHPPCIDEVDLDYQEAMEMWKIGEPEEARDALRFALEGCSDNLWIHAALGEIALKEHRDPRLAMGHFGYAFDLVHRVVADGFTGRIPRDIPANRPFHDALQGLIACLRALGETSEADRLQKMQDSLR
jgi:hypothetical protein